MARRGMAVRPPPATFAKRVAAANRTRPGAVPVAGAALASFGLLGYVASGRLSAPHGGSVLLFVPVDPIQNTACVFLGFALSTFATALSRRGSPTGRPG